MTLFGKLKKLPPVVTFLSHSRLLGSRMQSYRGLQYSTEILSSIVFPRKKKFVLFGWKRTPLFNAAFEMLGNVTTWVHHLGLASKATWRKSSTFRGKIIFHTYFWIRGLPVLVLIVFPLRRAPSLSSSLKPCANERLNVGQQLHVACYLYCVRLRTLLHVVGSCCEKFETSQTFEPTLLTFLFSSVITET